MLPLCLSRATKAITLLGMVFILLLSAVGSGSALTPNEAVDNLQQQQLAEIARAYDIDEHDLASKLSALGYTDINGFSADHVSAEALLMHATRRAEAANPGDGKRLLAVLARSVQANSATAASDPALAPLNAYTPAALTQPFTFSPDDVKVAAIKLPEVVERAVVALADHGWPHASISHALLRSLHKVGFTPLTLDLIAKQSPSLVEYLRRAIQAGTPPPLPADAVLAIISEVQSASAIAVNDPALNAIRSELSAPLPGNYETMHTRERFTPTARAEYAAMRDAARGEKLPIASLDSWGGGSAGSGAVPPTDPPEGPPPFSGPLAVDGDGSVVATGEHAKVARDAYQRWDEGTFGSSLVGAPPSGLDGGGKGAAARAGNDLNKGGGRTPRIGERSPGFREHISRSFTVASRSIRGPGGVSLGAPYTSNISDRPIQVRWLPKPSAPQFGYFLVTMKTDKGDTYSALSRVFYAESADAAQHGVFGVGADKRFVLKEGDILPLVSMTAEGSGNDVKAVVVNPALAGLKLAWSAVRADFWLRSFDGALADVKILKPDVDGSAARADAKLAKAVTWQIRERPFTVQLVHVNGLARILSCNDGSPCDAESYPPGFEIALFVQPGPLLNCREGAPDCTPKAVLAREKAIASTLVERMLAKLPAEKREANRGLIERLVNAQIAKANEVLQKRAGESTADWIKRLSDPDLQEAGKSPRADAGTRYIGWLTQNHPDFIRLNDFHHALAITRWLASQGVLVQPPGPLYAPRPYPIPNRIRGGDGGEPFEAFVANPP
jgi:hypothetical protein